MIHLLIVLLSFYGLPGQDGNSWKTPFEKSNGLESATYQQAIQYYSRLANTFNEIKMISFGNTDIGKPLNLVIISKDEDFDPVYIKKSNERILFIDNGIHPGEPCGIDASMMFARDLMLKPELNKLLNHVVVCIIPVYNIGGALNRSCCSRANQIGPIEYGFRGNDRNFDLDRDFIKQDTRNAQSFAQIFHTWDPDIFVDTHTSDGADYQYPMTLIATQKDKLQPLLSQYLTRRMEPDLYKMMAKSGYNMTPYVESYKTTPDSGIVAFMDSPLYSSGYAALFNTISFISEAHMLHTFKQRVEGTYALLKSMLEITSRDYKMIGKNHVKADSAVVHQQRYILQWKRDTTDYRMIPFNGYEARYKVSEVTGLKQLYYDESKPYTKKIRYYDSFLPLLTIQKPAAYLIPQGWRHVIKRLKINGVVMHQLSKDTTINVAMYHITGYQTSRRPFEAHYVHHDVMLKTERVPYHYYKGDYVVYTNQPENRYIVETMEPQSPVSFFAWNFFDSILMQKEYFESYVFDDTADSLLKENPQLRDSFEEKRMTDSAFAANAHAQLSYIYKHSKYFEKTYMRYPIGLLYRKVSLPIK